MMVAALGTFCRPSLMGIAHRRAGVAACRRFVPLADAGGPPRRPPEAQCLWHVPTSPASFCREGKWNRSIYERSSKEDLKEVIQKIGLREDKEKIRKPPKQMGTYHVDHDKDVNHMMEKFTCPRLASGLRAYDHFLQQLALLHNENDTEGLAVKLKPYEGPIHSVYRCEDKPKFLDEGETLEFDGALGVHRKDLVADIEYMTRNYTANALAEGIRIRCERIQYCAELLRNKDHDHLALVLKPFTRECILQKIRKDHQINWEEPLYRADRTLIRKVLTVVPRRLSFPHQKRSAVVLPLCHAYGVPCLLFQGRSKQLRSYPGDIGFPGGKAEYDWDKSIFTTGIREMEEEISGLPQKIEVIAALRCPWEEVQSFSSDRWAVTPIVAWIGEIGGSDLSPSKDESEHIFTIPIKTILDDSLWTRDRSHGGAQRAPIFLGGPDPIFGITGYILDRFVGTVLKPLQTEESNTRRDPTIYYE